MSLLNTQGVARSVGPEFDVTPSLATLLGHLDGVAHPRPQSDAVGVQIPVGGYGHVAASLTPLEEFTRSLVSWHNQLVEARRELGAASSAQRRVTELEKQLDATKGELATMTAHRNELAKQLESTEELHAEALRAHSHAVDARDTAVDELQKIRAAARRGAAAAAKKSSAKRRAR